MKLILFRLVLFVQTFLSCGKSAKTKNIHFTHGSIIERTEDVFLTASNIVLAVDLRVIFLPEDDVINLKSDLSQFAESLNQLHQRHFPFNPEILLAQTLGVAKMLSFDLQNKTAEAECLALDLLMWTVRHSSLERRNLFIFVALNVFGSVASLGLGISNRLKINDQNKRIEFLQHENELVFSELRKQLSSINQLMTLVNEHSSNINQLMDVQHLLATLAYYSSKVDHIRTKISQFIEKSKDYVEAITLATKGVLSPHLLPIKDLTLTLENGRGNLGYIPLLDAHKIEFYYSLISVSVENYRIMINIPFNSSDAWQSYKIAPFPTFMTNSSLLVISNLKGYVLISPNNETFTVIRDLDRFTHCSDAMGNKVCTAGSFEFHDISGDSCELGLALNGSLSHTRERCLKQLYPFDEYKFAYRLNNGSWIQYDRAGFHVACPDGSTASSRMFVAADGCSGVTPNYTVRGVSTIIRERAYFANFSWSSTIIPALPLPYNAKVAHQLSKLSGMDRTSRAYHVNEDLRFYTLLAVTCVLVVVLVTANVFAWHRLRQTRMDHQQNVVPHPDTYPLALKSFDFRAT